MHDFKSLLLLVSFEVAIPYIAPVPAKHLVGCLHEEKECRTPPLPVLQVELNTIASSFGCLSTLVGRMHRFILERSGRPDQVGCACLSLESATASIVTCHCFKLTHAFALIPASGWSQPN